jgi:HSP20 family protein
MNDIAKTPARQAAAAPLLDTAPMNWLRTEIDRLFDDFGQPARSIFNFGARATPVPALELSDTGTAYRLTAELPGMTDKDVTVELADGVLTVAREKSEDKQTNEGGCLISERHYGAFNRVVTLPQDADPDAISATFEHGLLTVTIDKDKKAAPQKRKIEIKG